MALTNPSGGIKSIQRGIGALAGNATSTDLVIGTVNFAKASLNILGMSVATVGAGASIGSYPGFLPMASLLNANTIRLTCKNTQSNPFEVSWEVIEYV